MPSKPPSRDAPGALPYEPEDEPTPAPTPLKPGARSPPPTPAEERRVDGRVPARLVVRFDSGPAFVKAYSGYTSNIGAGGLCLITRRSYSVGETLHLRIDVEQTTMELTGVVAWVRAGAAIGVKFDLLSEDQRKTVLTLVQRVSGIGV